HKTSQSTVVNQLKKSINYFDAAEDLPVISIKGENDVSASCATYSSPYEKQVYSHVRVCP
ncbi:hypothetical protein, partial [Escherichia coli]|uniref:hypothetical protein n=1 Tax=Escherichia coli TaxID=562 RepID=UPI001BC8481C